MVEEESISEKDTISPSVDATAEENEAGGDGMNTDDPQGSKMRKNIVPYYKLFSLAETEDIILMVVGTIGAIGNGISLPVMTFLFGHMINTFGKTTDAQNVVHEVSKVAIELIYLGVGTAVASFLQVACWTITGERQAARIRNLYLETLLRQDIEFFDMEANTGEIVGKMSGDTLLVQDAMGEKVGTFIQLVSSFIGGFVVAFIRGWQLTFVMMSIIPLVVLSTALMATVMTKTAAHGQKAYSEAAAIVEETIASIRTVASFTGEQQAVNKYNKFLKNAYKASVLEGFAAGIGMGATFGIIYCGYAIGIWFGSSKVLKGSYTGGDIIIVIIAVVTGSMSLGQASPCTSAFSAGQLAAFKMFYTINRKPKIDAYNPSGKILDDIQGDIEFRDVCFSYPARPEEKIFSGFSLFIPIGATVALVGGSGSGKSTVISLIERFYDPQAGQVLIDGINVKEFQLSWIRGKIGLVSQEPVLFASSIKDNIAYGKNNATIEEIRAAIELANASKFIDILPQGLDTMVGEHGSQLSGGEKQRVAIARAILKDPRILLLDEATSALDSESEWIVQDALERVMTARTTVVVAHRLSTVRSADMITVINQGSIMEKGSHDELLLDPSGAYSNLIRLQEVNQNSGLHTSEDNMPMAIEHQSSEQTTSMQLTVQLPSDRIGSDNSFSESLKSPTGVKIQDNTLQVSGSLDSLQQHKEVPLRRLAYLNKPELPVVLLGVIAAIASGLILPIFGLLTANIIHTFYEPPQKIRKDSNFWSLMFLVLGFATFVSFPARTYFFAVAGSKLIKRIRLMSFDEAVHMEIGWFDKPENSSGAIGARLSIDAATVRSLVGDALALLIQNIATLISGLLIAFSASWQLALIILSLIPVMGLNGWMQMKLLKGFNADAKAMYEEASQVARDAVGSIRTVASFTAEDKVMELYKKKCKGPVFTSILNGLISGISLGLSFFFLFCIYATSFYAGAWLIKSGKSTFPDVFRVFFSLSMVAFGMSQYSSLGPDAKKAKSATASVFAILDRKSKIDCRDSSGMDVETMRGNIEFRHVNFRYPTRPDIQIFQDLCLVVQSGKTVALVGESGSGKSTVVSLLQRFYDLDSGHIFLDGVEIQKLKLRWLRQQMGLVSQEPALFNDTIRANIAYGKGGEATEAEILAAAELANAHHFISGLQKGYDTIVGERGAQLSGGQKQRVAIARAVIKEPKILLLDEATSALDAESERVVQDALDRVMMNRTTITIAHRLSTVRSADLIAVVRSGMITEKGSHEELINVTDGAYASLVALNRC